MEKQWKTLEKLGFKEFKNEDYPDEIKFNGNVLGNYMRIHIIEYGKWHDFSGYDDEFVEYWGVKYDHDFVTIPQAIHKAVELKMIELGLWEE